MQRQTLLLFVVTHTTSLLTCLSMGTANTIWAYHLKQNKFLFRQEEMIVQYFALIDKLIYNKLYSYIKCLTSNVIFLQTHKRSSYNK